MPRLRILNYNWTKYWFDQDWFGKCNDLTVFLLCSRHCVGAEDIKMNKTQYYFWGHHTRYTKQMILKLQRTGGLTHAQMVVEVCDKEEHLIHLGVGREGSLEGGREEMTRSQSSSLVLVQLTVFDKHKALLKPGQNASSLCLNLYLCFSFSRCPSLGISSVTLSNLSIHLSLADIATLKWLLFTYQG